jgi:peptidoglycan-N-acetylglucosamine deacetylase
VKRISTILGLISVVVVSVFLVSVLSVVTLPGFEGITTELKRSVKRSVITPHQTRLQQFLLRRSRERLLTEIVREQKAQRAHQALPLVNARSGIVAAFYAPWQETGLHSLRANATKITHLMPAWVHLREDANGLDFRDWDPVAVPHNNDVLQIARSNNLNILPVLQNAQQSDFDPKRVHIFLTNPALQDRVITQLKIWLVKNRFQGINVDFENMPESDYKLYVPFLRRLKAALAPQNLLVSVDIEAKKTPLDWKEVASVCDFVVVMAYDEHASVGAPGPIASMDWYRGVLQKATQAIPRDKLVMGLANYAYDWTEGQDWAEPMTYQGALVRATRFRPGESPRQIVDFDDLALNPTFRYVDDAGKNHEVWFLDGVTAANQWMIAQAYGLRGVAVWVLGSSDPSLWTFIRRDQLSARPSPIVLQKVHFPYDIEFVGDGEITHVGALPTDGKRTLEVDPATGLLLDETYERFPTSYVIDRTGYLKGKIALTIDDGPAVPYTGEMLEVLKKEGVKATFFLIGQNAERYPGLVRRIWNEGHTIGNHSYTHPNIGAIPERRARFELNATQRVFQSILHRSTLLFRPPYNADAEPTSAEEVRPIALATSLNYITVLEFIDPQDWNTEELHDGTRHHRTAQEMFDSVIAQLNSEHGSCILLHDGGGDREETVKLLEILIPELKKRGYSFVDVSALIGSTRDVVNPPVSGKDTIMLASDRIVFEALYLFELFLSIAFISGIILGTLRMIFVTILALIEKYKHGHQTFDDDYRPSVSVVIAAFNEEKVIGRTIMAVLANQYPGLEIIIVDDGSKDDTSGEVMRNFGGNPVVHLMHQENAGKAAALNRGFAQASGEIIIALDADTIFANDTIAKLIRRFADPLVGAVAGNVKVGNRINPLTYWQAIEYVTSQNLDRRAYSVINSVTVVPGAVGAWRREAVLQAGGYSTDTMAEDMDLTWRIRRIGWRIATETEAIGYTEAPDSFRSLFTQRFRWAFGTLQCLWKHRRALGRYGWFGRVMLPALWLFQILYQAISPLVDLQIIWSVGTALEAWIMHAGQTLDWQPLPNALDSLYLIAFMYAFFFVIELIGSLIAFGLDREDKRMLVWLFWQRFLYRQLMYAVLLKSIQTAISGMRTGWGKLERKGTVELLSAPERGTT